MKSRRINDVSANLHIVLGEAKLGTCEATAEHIHRDNEKSLEEIDESCDAYLHTPCTVLSWHAPSNFASRGSLCSLSDGTEYLTKYASITARSVEGFPSEGRAEIMKSSDAQTATT